MPASSATPPRRRDILFVPPRGRVARLNAEGSMQSAEANSSISHHPELLQKQTKASEIWGWHGPASAPGNGHCSIGCLRYARACRCARSFFVFFDSSWESSELPRDKLPWPGILHFAFYILHSVPSGPQSVVRGPAPGFVGALWEPCGSFVGALWTHEGRMRVALRSHEGGFGVATAWLATRFEVALMSHRCRMGVVLGAGFCFLTSAFGLVWVV